MKKLALLGALVCMLPFAASAAALVDINTADATLLETLPGIGPAKAAAIIEYRTEHGSFAAIRDIQDVSGVGPSTYANIQTLITVANSGAASTQPASDAASAPDATEDDSSSTTSTPPASGTLTVQIGHARTVTLGTAVTFSAAVSRNGHADSATTVSWSFGDGSSASGRAATKTYRYAGTYAVRAIASDGTAQGEADATITVVPSALRISAIAAEGITLTNDASTSVDLSGWRLTAGLGSFSLPQGMLLLGGASILLSQAITGLPVAYDAKLYTTDNQLAAAYEFPMAVQPTAPAAGSYQVQSVESPTPLGRGADQSVGSAISSNQASYGTEAVSAPAAPTEVAAAGAALLPEDAGESVVTAPLYTRLTKALESPWALGVLGLLVFSGGALIVL